ncbi:hemoblobin-interacting domain-containing protein [Cohnella abietis]|uniref:SLH domain-containing protein n=1 Tax=Cohnella abietis TaxID=2507935 RepID=A0A3T1DEN2_9BACL|nr:S-layer homology domain-containing protein [Cohnella abietis]BBI36616.1 hypothetical protein KCTCHS21_60150 [Cohnella abietis]
MLLQKLKKTILIKLSMILAGFTLFSVLSISSPATPHASAESRWSVCGMEGSYCKFEGTRIIGYGNDYETNSKKITSRVYTMQDGSTLEGVQCVSAEFAAVFKLYTACYMLIDPEAELDTVWSTSTSDDNKTVSILFSVKETQVGTIADLKSKIRVKRTDDSDFRELDPEDTVSNVIFSPWGTPLSETDTSKLQITFKNPLMGTDNQLLIQPGALANGQGVVLNRPIAVDVLENDLGSWEYVGERGISTGFSPGGISMSMLNGTPYLAYIDYQIGNRIFVKKYNGSSWVSIDGGGLSTGMAGGLSSTVSGGNLYVSYFEYSDFQLHIKKYDGNSWSSIDVGNSVQTQLDGTGTFSLAIHNNTPYIAYSDKANGNKLTVKVYNKNKNSWDSLGNVGFSQDAVSQISLTIEGGIPYVAYRNEFPYLIPGHMWAFTPSGWVKKFDQESNSWSDLGKFSNDKPELTTLFIKDGIPYVAYVDIISGRTGMTIAVKKRVGNVWKMVDEGGSISNGSAYSFHISEGTLYLAYVGSNGKTTVKKLVGDQWIYVGATGITEKGASYSSVYVENGIPYIATSSVSNDAAYNLKPEVKKFLLTPPTLTADLTNNNTVSPVIVTFPDLAAWRSDITAVKDGADTLAPGTYTVSAGKITFNPGVLGLGSHTIKVSTPARYKDATVGLTVYLKKPILTADTTNNDVGHPIDISFPDDATWRGAITSVKDGATAITNYSVTEGKLTIYAGVLTEGNHTITITATDYADAIVNQTVTLIPSPVLSADTTNNDPANVIEITFPDDGAWRDEITAVKDGATTLPISRYSIVAGKIIFKAGALALGNHTIRVLAPNYSDATVTQMIVLKHPALAADTTTNDTESEIDVTFPDDPAWRGSITEIQDGATTLSANSYTVYVGKITFNAGVLSAGSHTLTVKATNYSDAIIRQDILISNVIISDDALLSNLTVNQGSLTFVSSQLEYSVNVANAVASVGFSVTKGNPNQALTVIGATETSVTDNVYAYSANDLLVGSNLIQIKVTAEDGSSSNTYKVTVTRDVQAEVPGGNVVIGGGAPAASNNPVTSTDGKLTVPTGKAGEVSLQNEVKVFIPADASAKDLIITIDKLLDTQSLLTDKEVLVSPIFEILKNFSENFKQPVTLTFAFDPTSLKGDQKASVFYYDEVKKHWMEVGGVVNGNRIVVEVNHFTKYAVFAVGQSSEVPTKEPSTDADLKLSDIAGHWAEANIKQAISDGIITGYPGGLFKPNHTVTRAEFAVMLVKTLKLQGKGAELTFSDSAKIGVWAQTAVSLAVREGIITGYGDGSFHPNAEITRAEMAVMIAKALGKSSDANAAASGFADDEDITSWAKGSVAYVKEAGIVKGKGDNRFAPQDHATRAEAVAILLRAKALKSEQR